MKKLLVILVLVFVGVGGCGTYWYQPGKTLEQCLQDSKECAYDANKHGFDYFDCDSLYRQCMEVRGYQQFLKEHLPMGIRTYQIDMLAGWNVAGE